MAVSFVETPSWLESLLYETFFEPCTNLRGCKEKNVLCLECCDIFCTKCVNQHSPLHHRHIQVFRYTSQNVVRYWDIMRLMDCREIQSHRVNGAHTFFLAARLHANPYHLDNVCPNCRCYVKPPNDFCSIFCKIQCLLERPRGLQGVLLYKPENPPEPRDEGHLNPEFQVPIPPADTSSQNLEEGESSNGKRKKAISRRKRSVPVRAPMF